jgi:hypothetical protein
MFCFLIQNHEQYESIFFNMLLFPYYPIFLVIIARNKRTVSDFNYSLSMIYIIYSNPIISIHSMFNLFNKLERIEGIKTDFRNIN